LHDVKHKLEHFKAPQNKSSFNYAIKNTDATYRPMS